MTNKAVKHSRAGDVDKPLLSAKVPEISRTLPPGQRENHGEYSVEASAAIKSSWKAI
jgi:hypothetical protein